ncbi:MAG: large repetitive protein [Patescibacteria group bacterium]|nr:large repetitive protein [Patescibacteria group bacterium]
MKRNQKQKENSVKKEKSIFQNVFVRKKIFTLPEKVFHLDSAELFDDYLSWGVEDKKKLGREYGRIAFWEGIFNKIKSFSKSILLFSFKSAYRLVIFVLVLVLIYQSFPGALSAPQSRVVTTKSEWDMGALTGVTSDTSQNSIQLSPNGGWTERVLASPRDTISYGSASVMAGNYLYVMRGYSDKVFWRYDTVNNKWETMPDLPQPAYYGADMTFIPGAQAGTGKIYAIFGGYSQKFYEFNIITQQWTRLPDLSDSTYTGSAIENDGTDIYFLRGNTSTGFYKFFVNASRPYWKDLSAVTANVNTGGDLVYGHDGYMYVTQGNTTVNFYRFTLPADEEDMGSWTTMASITATYTFAGEQRGVYWDSGTGSAKYLYFLRSNGNTTMHRYQITCDDGTTGSCAGQKDTWLIIAEAVPGPVNYTSLTYNATDGNFYAVRGNNGGTATGDLWKFDPDGTLGQQWLGLKNVQDGSGTLRPVNTGSDLIWNGDTSSNKVYAISGGATSYFNLFDTANNLWATKAAPSPGITADVTGTYKKSATPLTVPDYLYFPRGNASNTIYRFNEGLPSAPNPVWETLNPSGLGNIGVGGGVIYNGSKFYVLLGGASNYFYDCGADFSSCTRDSIPDLRVDNVNYFPYTGARMVSAGTYFPGDSNSTDIYATIGDGETTFLKYSGGAWSKMASTPFTQYYGTSLTYYAGKIYALAGYYKDEIWEYDISADKWIKMPNNQKYIYGRGPWQGANIEYGGNSAMLATIGMGLSDMWKFDIGATNFSTTPGTYVSEVMDLSNVGEWSGFSAHILKPANTNLTFETMTSSDNVSWPGSWSSVSNISESGGVFSADIDSDENRYVKVRITLTSSNGADTPTVYDYSVSYTVSGVKPQNPNSISGSSQQTGGTALISGIENSYTYEHPYFSWLGATHNGSGIAGYYVCFDTDENCVEPVINGGHWSFQSGFTYTATTPLKTGTYHLKIKTKDGNGNISDAIWDAFTYQYDGVSTDEETDPLSKTRTSADDFNDGDLEATAVSGSGNDASLRLAAVSGFWNQNRLSVITPGTVYQAGELSLGRCKDDADVTPPYSFNDNHCLYTMVGNNTTNFYRYEIETDTWTTRTVTPYNTNTGAALVEGPEGYLYAVRGTGNAIPVNAAAFWMYDIVNNSWVDLGNAPKSFAAGSNLSYDGRYIYATPGAEDTFYIYDTCNGEDVCNSGWKNPYTPSSVPNVDFDNPSTTNGQFTGEGADSVYDGRNNVYMIQGSQFSYFTKYSIADDAEHEETRNTWTPLMPAPEGFYYGGSLTYDSVTNAIYAIAGNNALTNNSKQAFLKYDIETDTWSALPDAPTLITQSGASLSVYDGYIYFLRGSNTNLMYRFNIAENSWELPNRGFFGQEIPKGNVTTVDSYFNYGAGTFLAPDASNNLYIIRGDYDNTFGRYDVESGSFTDLKRLPMGAVNGASISYGQDENNAAVIYYVPGPIRATRTVGDTKNPYFYKYIISTDTWEEITDRPPAKVAAGSSMAFDSVNEYLYLTQGGTTAMYRYDVNGGGASKWSTVSATGACSSGAGSKILYTNSAVYRIQAGGNASFCKFNGSAWSTLKVLPAVANTGASIFDGKDGYVYVARGADSSDYYRYAVSQLDPPNDVWETLSTTSINKIPANVNTGGVGGNLSNRNWLIPGAGTNTFANGLYSYVVGSATNQTGFSKTGTYTSDVIDLEDEPYRFANLTVNYVLPDSSADFLAIETRTSATGSLAQEDEDEWTSWNAVSNEHVFADKHTFSINSDTERYIQVRMSFSSSDQIFSPRVDDYAVYYYQDVEQPNAPSEVTAYRSNQKPLPAITNLTDPEHPTGQDWFGDETPYFEWPAAGDPNGASDNPDPGGSGIAGYYVCFGEEADCPDAILNGEFQTGNSFTAPALSSEEDSGEKYYLKISAIDNAGLASESYTGFIYQFDRTPPGLPTNINASPASYSSVSEFTYSWDSNASDTHSGILKFQYRLGNESEETWHDIGGSEVLSQVVEPYQPNENYFYLKVLDKAYNETVSLPRSFFWSGGPASPPTNLRVNPSNEDNVTNSFTFEWDIPDSYAGDADNITYFYSANYLPTPFNTVETTAKSAGPGPFATQFGQNTMYVVAMSEGGSKGNPNDVDWENPAKVYFYARTTAPGPPINNQIFDTSDRESAEYSVAVKWSVPESYDSANFAGYTIYRATDPATAMDEYEEVATTTGTAYVDTELESKPYYYYVRSRDRTNNLSIPTSVLSMTPTGRYTTAPLIVDEPAVTVESFAATIVWSTNREASSFVEYGTSSDLDKTNGQVDSVISHTVELTGLEAATKYYYKVKYIDPDGNIGTSEADIFTTNDPPTISDVVTSDVGLNSANVSWKTNMSGVCTLQYGEGSFTNSVEESAGGTTHIQKISNLKSATSYIYQIECVDADLNNFSSDQYAFTTLEQPMVADFAVQNKENVDIPTIEVTYNTTHATTTLVKFKGAGEGSYHNYLISDLATEHKATIEGLDPAVEYEVVASGIDANGVEALPQSSRVTTLTDSRPPGVVVNRAVGRVVGRGKDSRANLYVKIETDEITAVKILFGKGTILSNFEQSTGVDPSNTYHLITIPVDSGQVYSYVAEAVDEAGNKTISRSVTVVVEDAKENATEIVVNTFSSKFGWVTKLWQR